MKVKKSMALISLVLLVSCASTEKAKLMSTSPEEASNEVKTMKWSLIGTNVDVLARDEFKEGSDDLADAIQGLEKKKDRDDILNDLSEAKGHFLKAKTIAEKKTEVPQNILEARQSALKANAMATKELRAELDDIDVDLRDETNEFNVTLSADEYSKFQSRYLKLEGNSVQHTTLHAFRKIVSEAYGNNAEKLAPKTYVQAKTDLKVAENLIAQSPRDASQYQTSVDAANTSAKLLQDVMDKLKGEAKGSTETVALKLVFQERKLGKLSSQVQNLEGDLTNTQTQLGAVTGQLISTEAEVLETKAQVLSAKNQVAFQKAMENVRKSIDEEKASVYQQGDKLIFRLKNINFKVNSDQVPQESYALLGKINEIIKDINPSEITVQGHTDSTGEEAYNKSLSDKRAESVKEYFSSLGAHYQIQSEGYGESKPIANNESKEGRSENRRVDVVVKANYSL